MVFELAKRLGLGEKFWQGDIDAAYEHELAPTGLSLTQLKSAPGGITVSAQPRYQKFSTVDQSGKPVFLNGCSVWDLGEWRFIRTPSQRTVLLRCPSTWSL